MTVLLAIIAGLAMMTGLLLAIYLELRIDALVRSGDLPKDSPRIWGWTGVQLGISLGALYSRRLRETDAHTRALVPIIRVALPLALCAFLGVFVMEAVSGR